MFVDGERDDDSLAQLTYAPDGSTLTLSLPSFVHTQTVDIDVTTDRPDIDNPSDSVTTYHPQDDLAHAFECFTDRSSIVAFGYDDVDDECYLEAYRRGEAAPKITTRYRCPRERRPNSSTPEPARSTFSTARLAQSLIRLRQRRRSGLTMQIRSRFGLRGTSLVRAASTKERSRRLRCCLPPRDAVDTAEGSELTPNSPIKRRPPPILVMRPVSQIELCRRTWAERSTHHTVNCLGSPRFPRIPAPHRPSVGILSNGRYHVLEVQTHPMPAVAQEQSVAC